MQGEISFHHLARQFCHLLDCHAACLLPYWPEPALRHPLLDLLPIIDDALSGFYCPRGQVNVAAFLRHSQLRAFCDLAAQTGSMQHLAAFPAAAPFQSLAVIPLERPAGLLGFVLLLNERPEAFTPGDMLLLDCFLPPLLERMEDDLRRLVGLMLPQQLSRLRQLQEACQQRAAAREREEPDRIDNRFLSMVMHELRAPLAAIKGYTALLQAYPPVDNPATREEMAQVATMTPQRQQHYLATIMEQVTHLEVLVRDLLDISRIHAGRLSLHCVPVDLAQLCQHAVELLQQQASSCDLRCIASPDLPPVWADPDRVQQALTNLLENAIKYSPNGGLIEVCVSAHSTGGAQEEYFFSSANPLRWSDVSQEARGIPAIQVTVRDHGMGIAPEQQTQLFKPFQRLEHPLTGDISGAGLGLYITRKFIQAMGGQIKLESCMGEGTTVSFTLPARNPISANTEAQIIYPAIAKRHPVCYSVPDIM